MYEVLIQSGGKGGDWITYDLAHTEDDAKRRAALLRSKKGKITDIVDRDQKKAPRLERRSYRDDD